MRLYLNKIVVLGAFLSQRSPSIMSSAKCEQRIEVFWGRGGWVGGVSVDVNEELKFL